MTFDQIGFDRVVADIATRAGAHDRDASFAHEALPALHEVGVLNLTVPASRGGDGAGLGTFAAVLLQLGAADPSVALVVFQHLIFHRGLAVTDGAGWEPGLLDRVVTSSIEGVALASHLRVEPDLGTPARGGVPVTTAKRGADGTFLLHGQKRYCTGVPGLRWLAVWAATDDAEPVVGSFVVEATDDGHHVVETWDHLGLRASGSHDVVFDGVHLAPDRAVIPAHSAELVTAASSIMAWNNVGLAALYTGVAQASRDWLVTYLNERVPTNLGAPLATLPRFQQAVGEIESLLLASRQLIASVAAEVDAAAIDGSPGHSSGGQQPGRATDGGFVKVSATTNAVTITQRAVELTGNPGLSRANPLERHLRDALCGRVHTPQDDSIAVGLGRDALAVAPR